MFASHRYWAAAIALATCQLAAPARADTLWIENAENGYGQVIDGTHASYPLIQSSLVAEGSHAFHLAHPNAEPNWFTIDKTLTIQPTSKLFFMSRLGYATPTQHARVQISSDGGGTWATSIYEQPGSGGAGEAAFSMKEISLSAYANQDLRFRFFYDISLGQYYDQTDPVVGWLVDNIQIGDAFAKLQWSIGDPTPREQLYLEYINRARNDALAEAQRLRYETDPDVLNLYTHFGIDGADIVNQFQWYVDNGAMDRYAQPLSFESHLMTSTRRHTMDQVDNNFTDHFSSNNPPPPFQPGYGPGQRATAVGYSFVNLGENVGSGLQSVPQGHAGFDADGGAKSDPADPFYNPDFVGQGMQNPAGHRRTIHSNVYKEVGISVLNRQDGAQVVTQDFGNPGNVRYITGVVYRDLNGNQFYDIGEGRGGVRVDVEGSAYYAISTASGGYSLPVPADGVYEVDFTGGGFQAHFTSATVAGTQNVKLDYLVSAIPFLAGDYNNDHTVNAADYTVWRNNLGSGTALINDDTRGVGPDDYARWKMNYGEANGSGASFFNHAAEVPEPASLMLLGVAVACFTPRVCRSVRSQRPPAA